MTIIAAPYHVTSYYLIYNDVSAEQVDYTDCNIFGWDVGGLSASG
jgi:hypothetical protein